MRLACIRIAAIATLFALGLAAPGFAQTAPPEPPAAGKSETLTGAAAIAAIAGNTLTGKVDGEEKTIFLATDGRLTMLEDSEQTQGKWELRGARLCVIIEDEDDDCYGLEVAGDIAILREDATTAYRLNILRGNARNLPLAAAKR